MVFCIWSSIVFLNLETSKCNTNDKYLKYKLADKSEHKKSQLSKRNKFYSNILI